MEAPPQFTLARVHWADASPVIREIRTTVFIQEQSVPPELEWDEWDVRSAHVLARVRKTGEAVGTGRLLPDGHLGRMAVIKPWRGNGIGSAILNALLDIAQSKRLPVVMLHAQTQAVGFYKRFGFQIISDEFIEAGIPHRAMQRLL
jgi:predicted GNAT family N-acyltransferase